MSPSGTPATTYPPTPRPPSTGSSRPGPRATAPAGTPGSPPGGGVRGARRRCSSTTSPRCEPDRLRVRLTGAEQTLPPPARPCSGPTARVVQARLGWRLRRRTGRRGLDGVAHGGARPGGCPAGRHRRRGRPGRLGPPAVVAGAVTRMTQGDVTVLAGPWAGRTGHWADLAVRAAADAREHLPERAAPGLGRAAGGGGPGQRRRLRPGARGGALGVRDDGGGDPSGGPDDPGGRPGGGQPRHRQGPRRRARDDADPRDGARRDPLRRLGRAALGGRGAGRVRRPEAHPGQRPDEVAALRRRRPTRLPRDAAFTAGGKDVTAAYAQAWLVCKAVAEHRGDATWAASTSRWTRAPVGAPPAPRSTSTSRGAWGGGATPCARRDRAGLSRACPRRSS